MTFSKQQSASWPSVAVRLAVREADHELADSQMLHCQAIVAAPAASVTDMASDMPHQPSAGCCVCSHRRVFAESLLHVALREVTLKGAMAQVATPSMGGSLPTRTSL